MLISAPAWRRGEPVADYTIELKDLIERGYKLALDSYPIFDENYREILNQKIIKHYWLEEIGQETPDRFNYYLEERMGLIMPYYNELYLSTQAKFNPFFTDYVTTTQDNEQSTLKQRGQSSVYSSAGGKEGVEQQKTIGAEDNITVAAEKQESETGNTTTRDGWNTFHKEGETGDVSHETNSSTRTDNLKNTVEVKADHDEHTETEKTIDTTDTLHSVKDTKSDTQSKGNSFENVGFSDVPQSGYETITTTAPDGTVTTTSKGYLTTQTTTTANNQNNSNATGHDTTDSTDTIHTLDNTNADTSGHNNSTTNGTNTGTVGTQGEQDITKGGEYNEDSVGHETDNLTDKGTGSSSSGKAGYTKGTEQRTVDNQSRSNTISQSAGFLSAADAVSSNLNMVTTRAGRQGVSPSQLLLEYRKTLINVDKLIINELRDLFMLVY
ncbi:MAG: lower collar protein [Podoviridae sp. ctjc_2]|nr:MAG: lower collar protein [Podoviridae sp. ctjc_2]